MALRRFTTSVDGTIPIPALLYNDEELLASQDNVGIYDGFQKAANHQSGTIHATSHRIFFVNSHKPTSRSFSMDIVHVIRTDYYGGLFKSSPKVTLYLDGNFVPSSISESGVDEGFESWVCEVCNYRNPPGLSPAAAPICALCGVPRSAVAASPEPKASNLSASFPSLPTSAPTSSRSPTPPPTNGDPTLIACTACTFLNHPFLRICEVCSTPLPLGPGNSGINTKSAPSSRPASPLPQGNEPDPVNPLIKISFRKGGDKAFYSILRRSLKARAWEGRQIGKGPRSGSSSLGVPSPEGATTPVPFRRSGIDGILRNVEVSAQNIETDLSDAFKDLEAIMVKAQDLVHLAAELNEKLSASSNTTAHASSYSGASSPWTSPSSTSSSTRSPTPSSLFATTSFVPSAEPEEAKFIRSSLAQLGLQLANAPVTADMMRDERKWIEELARELAGVLQGSTDEGPGQKPVGIMKERGVVGLDEIWGGWNRARGVALIPPSTFLQTLPHLPYYTCPPISSRTFKSGLRVLHTPPYTHAAFAARLSGYLTIYGVQTTSEIAEEESITISLATEMISAVETDGTICRDDGSSAIKGGGSGSGSELRWSRNLFQDYIWDGHTLTD
ncbi:EAP30/Vps36 family-domain-containing protein [Melanogaster broomeanus]|nr:EAP30/Vps36 family-domain-containing protein [Melanogaster broomeanus]